MMQSHLFLSALRASALAALLASGFAPVATAQEEPSPGAGKEVEGVHRGLFATGVLEGLEIGDSIVFRHERAVDPDNPRMPDINGTAEVSVAEAEAGGREARVALVADGRTRPVPPLAADAGHPLLLIFLETAVRTMADATGGSPFYIRNRIRDTLWTGGGGEPVEIRYGGETLEAEELVYRPFAQDPNRAEMGGFADLELRFLVSDSVPGRIALLALQAPQGESAPQVSEILALEGVEEEEKS